jgi:hypothetical protein
MDVPNEKLNGKFVFGFPKKEKPFFSTPGNYQKVIVF